MKKKYIIAAFIFSILIIAGWWYFGFARMNRMYRESLLDEIYPSNNRLLYPTKKHNSLYDARVIKSIYEAYMTSC